MAGEFLCFFFHIVHLSLSLVFIRWLRAGEKMWQTQMVVSWGLGLNSIVGSSLPGQYYFEFGHYFLVFVPFLPFVIEVCTWFLFYALALYFPGCLRVREIVSSALHDALALAHLANTLWARLTPVHWEWELTDMKTTTTQFLSSRSIWFREHVEHQNYP